MNHIKHFLLSVALVATSVTVKGQNQITIYDSNLGQDEVFDLPEGMLVSEDSLLNEWQAKNYLFPDTTCENPNFNPEYAPEVYRERLQRLPTIIEMTYNDIVQNFIDRYTNKMRRQVSAMLGACNLYVPIFEEALDFYGIPLELKYLPVIESAMNPKAVSPVGATGLWQFMLATGKQYGLNVNSLVDERRDPIKQTWAAARYLRDLFKIYGDWHLVLAAYNCGPGNVNKAIHRSGGERNYWKIYAHLPKETRGYVPAFIAANYIMNYYCDHNICPMLTKYPIQTDTLMVSRKMDMRQIAELCDLDLDVVKALNPQYKTNVIPGNNALSTLRLPQESIQKFLAENKEVTDEQATTYVEEHKEVALDPKAPAAQPEIRERKAEADKALAAKSSSTTSSRSSRNSRSSRRSRTTQTESAPTTTTKPSTTKSSKSTSQTAEKANTATTSSKSTSTRAKKAQQPTVTETPTKKSTKTTSTTASKSQKSTKSSYGTKTTSSTSKTSSKKAAAEPASKSGSTKTSASSKKGTASSKASSKKETTTSYSSKKSATAETSAKSSGKSTTSSKSSATASKKSTTSSKSATSTSKSATSASKKSTSAGKSSSGTTSKSSSPTKKSTTATSSTKKTSKKK